MHRSYDVEDNGQRFVFVKVKSEQMYFLVNASPPKPFDIAISKFADALVRSKAGFCDGVPSTEVKFFFNLILYVPVNKFSVMSGWVFLG